MDKILSEVKGTLTESESDNLSFGAILMTYECGMRFLTDYLEGDVYFKIRREGHNLDRMSYPNENGGKNGRKHWRDERYS